MIRVAPFVLFATALGVLIAGSTAAACTVDSIPSAIVGGRAAIAFDGTPGAISPAHYAPFIVPGVFGTGWTIRFGELASGLTLTPAQHRSPWSWSFGDGVTRWGHTVTHAYRTPGDYVVTVAAHPDGTRFAFGFDRILVRVVPAGRVLAQELPILLRGSRYDAGAALRGGLLPLQRLAAGGLIPIASQVLGQIDTGAWASIVDYWRHERGSLPAPYARLGALLRREGAALDAGNQGQAAAIAGELVATARVVGAPSATTTSTESVPWAPIVAVATGLLIAIAAAFAIRPWRKLSRATRRRPSLAESNPSRR